MFEEWKEDYGEDSDIFRVKVKGEFPRVGSVQFIANDLVYDAMRRVPVENKDDPLVIGVDVARFGSNDTVIYPRMGLDAKTHGYKKFNGLDTTQVVDKVIETIHEFRLMGKDVSGLFIDGGGLGAGPVDILRRLGYSPIDVNFGGRSGDRRYHRKGDEMWGNLRDALPKMSLVDDQDLVTQITQREYDLNERAGTIQLESKKDMMERLNGNTSPDIADALALTFAQTVNPAFRSQFGYTAIKAASEYDPYDNEAFKT